MCNAKNGEIAPLRGIDDNLSVDKLIAVAYLANALQRKHGVIADW